MTYDEHHAALVQYLLAKVDARDWHGVSDAANDLRVLEATHPYQIKSVNEIIEEVARARKADRVSRRR